MRAIQGLLFLSLFLVVQSIWAQNFKVSSDGELSFYQKSGQRALVKEYAGKIVVDGSSGEVLYQGRVVGDLDFFSGRLILCQEQFANECELSFGKKVEEGKSVQSVELSLKEHGHQKGIGTSFNALDRYVYASPNQEEGGTCLYMASTGAMEILLNKHRASTTRSYDGVSDLSERFLMSLEVPGGYLGDWRTDTILSFNYRGKALLNRDYRYTKGWYKGDETTGNVTRASAKERGAKYGTYYNWVNDYDFRRNREIDSKLISVPKIARDLIFVDPAHDQWNVGVMDSSVIEKIKSSLRRKNAPVLIIYNHYAYWHAVLIVGYDDEQAVNGCAFVNSWKQYMAKEARASVARGKRFQRYIAQVNNSIAKNGGCSSKGVFYVRDSIYDGVEEPIYDYDPAKVGEETRYSKRIILRSYDWAKYLGNHAYVIYSQEQSR
ncbi:MAG: hypothetical protein HQK52_09570 [Oligoflexia bacterium]|nr:hypothetical protein [Oligoflexia bacterium]